MTKLGDKKRKYKVDEDDYSHPRHEPYKREHKDWHNLLLDGEEELPEEDDEDSHV